MINEKNCIKELESLSQKKNRIKELETGIKNTSALMCLFENLDNIEMRGDITRVAFTDGTKLTDRNECVTGMTITYSDFINNGEKILDLDDSNIMGVSYKNDTFYFYKGICSTRRIN